MASKPDVLGARLAGLPGCAGQLRAPEAHGLKPPLPFLLLLCSLLQVMILPPKQNSSNLVNAMLECLWCLKDSHKPEQEWQSSMPPKQASMSEWVFPPSPLSSCFGLLPLLFLFLRYMDGPLVGFPKLLSENSGVFWKLETMMHSDWLMHGKLPRIVVSIAIAKERKGKKNGEASREDDDDDDDERAARTYR